MHCITVLPTVLGVCSVKICMNRLCSYVSHGDYLLFRGVKSHKLRIPDQVCEESGVSLEHLPRSFLKTEKGAVFETSPDMPEAV